jgi:autotransporter-associated beta strand protein
LVSGGTLIGSAYHVEAGTLSTVLAGGAQLTKSNSGTVTLNNVNTYTGGTVVNMGTLALIGADLLATGGSLTLTKVVMALPHSTQTQRCSLPFAITPCSTSQPQWLAVASPQDGWLVS